MYGKLFASLYEGTLRGRAHEILVFTNLIAHAQVDGTVDRHWKTIAEEVGLTIDEVKKAIENLEAPDPESRTPDEGGARLIRLDEHRFWGWRIVNHGKYRAIRNEEDRRMQNAEAQKRWREAHHKQNKPPSAEVIPGNPIQKHSTEAKAEEKKAVHPPMAEGQKTPTLPEVTAFAEMHGVKPELAHTFWHHYESIGWIDPFNRPIQSWTSKLMTWNVKEANRVAEKDASTNGKGFWESMKRLELVEKEILRIENSVGRDAFGTLMLSDKQRTQLKPLRSQRIELKTSLGLQTMNNQEQTRPQP